MIEGNSKHKTTKLQNPKPPTLKIIISGGGSGGHVFPAIAIANEIKRQRPNVEILFVGAEGKIEMEKIPKAGYKIEGLWISGFHRKLTLRNLMFPIKLINSLWRAHKIINRFRPDIVVGVGGYASGPTLEMAARKGIPTLIQEQNSYPGITNKLLAKRVNKICVAYDNMKRFFPNDKIVETGNPVRQDIMKLDGKRAEGAKHFGFDPAKQIIFVFGGSLGARTINDSMAASTALIEAQKDVQILWQAGKLYIEEFKKSDTANLSNVKVSDFIDRMDLAYAMADVVICRAGALAISELCLVAKPAILIPSPNVSEDHQTKNAMALVEKKAAVIVKDKDSREMMMKEALSLLENEEQQRALSTNVFALAKPDAASNIAAEVLNLAENEV